MKARDGSVARAHGLTTFGRNVAAAQGVLDDRPAADWLAYGQACQDALSRGRPVPALRPATAPLAPPSPAPPPLPHRVESGRRPLPARRVWRFGWGVAWRYAILGGLFLFAQSRPQKPWLVILGVLVVGLLLGLWRRRSGLARLWRAVVVAGGAVYVAPLFAIYPDVLVGSIGALTLGPLLATWRRD
jgi:hypothetical protein